MDQKEFSQEKKEKVRVVDIHNPDMICRIIETEAKETHIMYLEAEIHVLCKKAIELEENLKVAEEELKTIQAVFKARTESYESVSFLFETKGKELFETNKQLAEVKGDLIRKSEYLTDRNFELAKVREELAEANKQLAKTKKNLDEAKQELYKDESKLQFIAEKIVIAGSILSPTKKDFKTLIKSLEEVFDPSFTQPPAKEKK
jgi:chromosome segregation ATPase